MPNITGSTALWSIPLVLLLAVHLWLFQSCLFVMNAAGPPGVCSSPPLSTLLLLALAFVELTRGSRVRGAIALVAVAIPFLLIIVSEVIT